MIQWLKQEKKAIGMSYRNICMVLGLAYSSLMRWKKRIDLSKPLTEKRGPKKLEPIDLIFLENQIHLLNHKNKRTMGTTGLYEQVKEHISRRDFQKLVHDARMQAKLERINEIRHINWQIPGMAWTMDDTEYTKNIESKLILHNVQDLSSRYKFTPFTAESLPGPDVANHLKNLFDQYGAPLFLKRDNGPNLNHNLVNLVLSEYFVISFNSPGYYPKYNGAIEYTQGELKRKIEGKLDASGIISAQNLGLCAELSAHDLNHAKRPCLKGKTSCDVFFNSHNKIIFNKKKRREIFEWLQNLFFAILTNMDSFQKQNVDLAWRIAIETWLKIKGYIQEYKIEKVLPNFSLNLSHN
jgi:transposase InsO family protein